MSEHEADVNEADRATTELVRARQAMRGDETAQRRDATATSRDRAADARDVAAEEQREAVRSTHEPDDATIQALLIANTAVHRHAAADRAQAAADRGRAAADRAQAVLDRARAAADRAQAAAERRQARVDLQRAQLDALTGVFLRDLGYVTLQHEIDRSRRSGEPFVLAFVDVDGLKALNDRDGHAAGDALLQTVVRSLRSCLRSYDPVVRVGGDEFLCGFTNTQFDAAVRRVAEIGAAVKSGAAPGSITVGLAALRVGDSLDVLMARADADMYVRKQSRR